MPKPCDFCPAQDATRIYPAHTFTITTHPRPTSTLIATSLNDWYACEPCASLIDANNGYALADRAVTAILAKHPTHALSREQLFHEIAKWHASFFANRKTTP